MDLTQELAQEETKTQEQEDAPIINPVLVKNHERYLNTPVQDYKLDFFNAWVENGCNMAKTCRLTGITYKTASSWVKKSWWKELHEEHVNYAAQAFTTKMSNFHEKTLEAWEDIVMGVDTSDKTASARVNAIKLYMESGKNPIIDKKTNLQIDARVQTQNIMLDISKVKGLSKEQLLHAAKTGEVPDELLLK